MNKIVYLIAITLLIESCTNKPAETETKVTEQISTQVLRHVVLFKFNETSSSEAIQSLENDFIALSTKIKEIKDFEWGINNSPEGLNKGFTHCFFVTFDDEAGLATYLPHPDHQAFVKKLGDHVEDVLVLDYLTK